MKIVGKYSLFIQGGSLSIGRIYVYRYTYSHVNFKEFLCVRHVKPSPLPSYLMSFSCHGIVPFKTGPGFIEDKFLPNTATELTGTIYNTSETYLDVHVP